MNFQDGKSKNRLGGHTDGPFLVLYRTTHTFVIQLGDVVERVNSYLVEWAPTSDKNATPREALEATPEDLVAKKEEDLSGWLRTWWSTELRVTTLYHFKWNVKATTLLRGIHRRTSLNN